MQSALDRLDLNLLRVFNAIMVHRSITVAGTTLGLTQSSTSHALARLRQHLGDVLFVRTTHGMQPTPFAEQLSVAVDQAFAVLEEGVQPGATFDPKEAKRTFTLLTTDIAELHLFPLLIAHLAEAAPNVRIISVATPRAEYRTELEKGTADLALGRLPEHHVDFYHQRLFDVPIGLMLRSDHPLIGDRVSLEQFMATTQIAVSEPAQVNMLVTRALGKRASQRRVALLLSHYLAVPTILSGSDHVAVMPYMGVDMLVARKLRFIPLPFHMPPFSIAQFWHERDQRDEGHRWLRSTISKLFMGHMGELHDAWMEAEHS